MESSDRDPERFDRVWRRTRGSIMRFVKLYEKDEPQLKKLYDELNALTRELIRLEKSTTKKKTVSISSSILGGVCTIAGLAFAPATAGISTALAIAGTSLSAGGGVAHAGVDIYKSVTVKKHHTKVETILSKADNKFEELFSALTEAGKDFLWLHKFASAISFEEKSWMGDHVNLWPKLHKVKDIFSLTKALFVLQGNPSLRVAAETMCMGKGSSGVVYNIGKAAPVAMSRAARIAAASLAGGFLLFDVKNIIGNVKHLAKGCKTKEAQDIQKALDAMKSAMSVLKLRYKEMKQILSELTD